MNIEKEIWKNIEVNSLKYEVSNYGRIIGISSGKILKTRLNRDGYVEVTLGKNSTGRITEKMHRLVAKLFVDNPNYYLEVNHKDFNRENNYARNLEWVTHQQNIQYTVQHKRHASYNGKMTGENNPNYGNNALKLKYRDNPELAKENNSRPNDQNGRSKIVKLYDINKIFIKQFTYIGACADYLLKNNFTHAEINSIRSSIRNSFNTDKSYLKHFYEILDQ